MTKTQLLAPALIGALTTLFAACDYGLPAGASPHRELNFTDMGDQPKAKPQRGDLLSEWPNGMLAPPPGSLAVDEHPYPFTKEQGDLAGQVMRNPLEATPVNVARGKFVFEHVCIACHGAEAAGDGEVTRLFPKPPSLMTQRVRDWSDGRIFHVPMRGQNSMPSHSQQLEDQDIWAVILYIRALQQKLPVAPPPPTTAPSTGG